MLSTLGLPGFDRPNWESTIRGLVAIHPRYTGINNWRGTETADITYDDLSGDLTAILIAKGYLGAQVWRDARPKYFMEVKTTTGTCGDRLFISSKQYQMVYRRLSHSFSGANKARCETTRSHLVNRFRMFTFSVECLISAAII
jgi:hypothetical protein